MTEEKENIIKEVCKELNITQTELGRQLDVSASTINTWASGKITTLWIIFCWRNGCWNDWN